MNIYTGKNSSQRSDEPLGQRVVFNLLELVTNLSEPKYHEVYFDNFFSSAEMLKFLSDRGFIAGLLNYYLQRSIYRNSKLAAVRSLQRKITTQHRIYGNKYNTCYANKTRTGSYLLFN